MIIEGKPTGGHNINTHIEQTQLVSIEARRVGWFLLWIAIGLTLAHVICMVGWYRYGDMLPFDDFLYISFFDLDEEESLGTWFSALILFFASALTLFQARFPLNKLRRWHFCWWLLGIGFCVLSIDEVAGFHEFVNTVVEGTHWTTFGAIVVLVTGLAFLPFMLKLPFRTMVLFLAAGSIYVGGAVGVEYATLWHEENRQLNTLGYNLWNALEEFMEMAGVILYIYALLAYIESNWHEARLHVEFNNDNKSHKPKY